MFLKLPKLKFSRTKWLVLAGAVMILVGRWFWYQKVCLNPYNVFWGTVDNNLATNGITRQIKSNVGSQTFSQFIRLETDSQKTSETLETSTQTGSSNSVTRQTIGTKEADFARYTKISTGKKDANAKPINYSNIEGVWSKAEAQKGGRPPSQYFNQAVLSTIPTANFNPDQRRNLIKTMRDKGVFNIDYKKVTKQKDNGKNVYIYAVNIAPLPYFEMMHQYIKQLGLDDTIVPNPIEYKNLPPLQIQISIKPTAKQIVKIRYLNNNQEEIYSGHGQNGQIDIPKNTIPTAELLRRIQQLQ